MLRSIMEGRYHFHSPEWDDISESAKNLVSSIFRNLKFEELTIIYKYVSLSPCINKHALYWDKMKGSVEKGPYSFLAKMKIVKTTPNLACEFVYVC